MEFKIKTEKITVDEKSKYDMVHFSDDIKKEKHKLIYQLLDLIDEAAMYKLLNNYIEKIDNSAFDIEVEVKVNTSEE